MAEIPKFVGDSSPLSFISETGLGDMGTQKIANSNQEEGSLETTDVSDSFIVDIESLSHGSVKDITVNSRISVKLQRNLSRKGSQRGERNKTTLASGGLADGSSNASLTSVACNAEKSTPPASMLSLGTKEPTSKQPQQAITVTAENRCGSRRFCKQRTCWTIDPRRVLFFFATLSSMGTIILIYFTLSIRKYSGDNSTHSQ